MDLDLLQTFNSVKDAIGKYVVTPTTNFGLGGFIFDVEGATNVDLTADITDHFTENNVTVQDHIAIRPKRIKLDTYVGELVYYDADTGTSQLQTIARKLTVLNSYLPALTSGAQQVKDIFDSGRENITFSKVADSGLNLYSLTKNILPPTTKQEQAYQYFKALMQQKILVSVQTPFEFCTNMAIESVFATQEEDSKYISNFSISLKEIRTVSTSTITFREITSFLDRAGIQDSPQVNGGKMQGTIVDNTQKVDLFTSAGKLL